MFFHCTMLEVVEKRVFYGIGKILFMSMVRGGEAPSCFSKAVADYCVYGHQ